MSFQLVHFDRNNTVSEPVDLGEKIGNFGLGLLCIGFGKTVEVSKLGNSGNQISYKEKIYSVIQRVGAIALSIISFPVIVIGYIGFKYSTSHQNMLNNYLGYKKQLSGLLNMDFSKWNTIAKLCKNVPSYDPDVKIDVANTTTEKLEQSRKELIEVVQHQQNLMNTQELIKAKTQYLKMRDVCKFSKHQGKGIPNPSVELALTPCNKFNEELQALLTGALEDLVLKDPSEPITQIPEYLYKYDHPKDSKEGMTSCFQVFGGQRQANPNWESTLDFVQQEVLLTPIKNLNLDGLYKLIFSLHDKLVGRKEKIRDQFSIVANPKKSEASISSIKAYLQSQKDGDRLVKRFSRFNQKVYRWKTMEKAATYITPKQWQALQSVTFVPPSPVGLDKKAMAFLKTALQLMNDDAYHPYQVAAFLHYGLTELHLFEDANGRLSRLLTNIYLMQNGYEPFYVTEDYVYTNLFQKEPYDVHFAKFLLCTDKQMKKISKQEAKNKKNQRGCTQQ